MSHPYLNIFASKDKFPTPLINSYFDFAELTQSLFINKVHIHYIKKLYSVMGKSYLFMLWYKASRKDILSTTISWPSKHEVRQQLKENAHFMKLGKFSTNMP